MNRRTFTKTLSAVAMFGSRGLAAGKLSLQIGHTGLTWIPLGPPVGPRPAINPMQDPQYVEAAIRDISSLGFYGIELFGNQIEAMEEHGGARNASREVQPAAHLRLLRHEPVRSSPAQRLNCENSGLGESGEKVQRPRHRRRSERRPA